MSACSDNQSTILPFPSAPHGAPTTTTLAIPRLIPLQSALHPGSFSYGKPVPTVSGSRALPSSKHGRGPLACEALIRIKEAALLGKQEGPLKRPKNQSQPLDIPYKISEHRSRRRSLASAM